MEESKKELENKWVCEYCSSVFKSRRILRNHFKICEEKNKLPKDKLGRTISEKSLKH